MRSHAFIFAILTTTVDIFVLGSGFTVLSDKTTIAVGDTVVLTCTKTTALTSPVTWASSNFDAILTTCHHAKDYCLPSMSSSASSGYYYSSDIASHQFSLTITNIQATDSATFTCGDGNEDGSITLIVPTPTIAVG